MSPLPNPPSTVHRRADAPELPRLLYVGDVPVESSYHGSALLYRLLQDYPADQLRIVETNLVRSLPERRLPGVAYAELHLGHPRPLYTRFARGYRAWLTWRAAGRQRRLPSLLPGFRPQAVLTVTHGFAWRTAARFAAQHHLPLHLICHDDLPRLADLPVRFRGGLDREFRRVYRQAASRLCVSPFMRDAYRERYGAEGEVLYPSRAADCPDHAAPPGHLLESKATLTGAYAGSINSEGYARAVRQLAHGLAALGGRLLLFGPLRPDELQSRGLNLPNVIAGGLVPFRELIERCRADADFLFVPMSFEPADRPNMELSFPSKLTDYTASGLPLLIWGPPGCSAVRWVRDNPGVAELVETDEPAALLPALRRLGENPAHRFQLAEQALALGRQFFSHAAGQRTFHHALGAANH